MKKAGIVFVALVTALCLFAGPALAKKSYRVAWSHYTGWEPWELARHQGFLDKWGEKYGIKIQLDLVNDYVESINLYTGGTYDACVMTNMDALTIPAVGGVDSTALIIGDFSNGNDGLVSKVAAKVPQLKDKRIMLVELSVSHYLLARALEKNGLKERDVKLTNTSDSDIAAVFESDPQGSVVTWNPPLMQCRNARGAKLLFDSSEIPGEIIDMMVVKTKAPEALKKALTGAWYETMALMSGKSAASKKAIAYMARFAGGTEAEFKAQLRTTQMFYKPAGAAAFARGEKIKTTMDYVRNFSFDHGLYGDADSADFVGMEFPDGSIMGNKNNVKLRFDAKYMEMAADGKL